jgi:4'-phosphopantetheinyl transferase EntD
VACDVRSIGAVGVDLELLGALDLDDARVVLDRTELSEVTSSNLDPTILWSAKESAFKAWSHATGGDLDAVDPTDMHVSLTRGGGLDVTAHGPLATRVAPTRIAGRWIRAERFVVTICSLGARNGVHGGAGVACHHRGYPRHPC